ncbi:MAG: hypothetical protein ACI9AR_000147 [Flavobacteriaceae bacterium]|jgi:hypothetical protein
MIIGYNTTCTSHDNHRKTHNHTNNFYMITFTKKENSDQQESEKTHIKTKAQEEAGNLAILDTTVKKTVSAFHGLIVAMIMLSVVIWLFVYVFCFVEDSCESLVAIGGVFMILAFYLSYIVNKVKKTTNYLEIKKSLNTLFLILIPFSLFISMLMIVGSILGIIMFLTFIMLSIRAFKFYRAFNYAKRNNLI